MDGEGIRGLGASSSRFGLGSGIGGSLEAGWVVGHSDRMRVRNVISDSPGHYGSPPLSLMPPRPTVTGFRPLGEVRERPGPGPRCSRRRGHLLRKGTT